MKHRRVLFSLALAALFALLCFSAFAAVADTITINNGPNNSGVTLSSRTPYLLYAGGALVAVTYDPVDAKLAKFDYTTGTLTLYGNVTIDNRGNANVKGAINAFVANGDLEITKADSVASASLSATGAPNNNISGDSCCIFIKGRLTVTGGSTVNGTGDIADLNSYGVYAGNLSVAGGSTVNGTGSSTTFGDSYGVLAGNIAVEGGSTVTGTGGEAYNYSFGVYANKGLLSVTDSSTVTGTGGAAENYSFGVYAGNLSVADSSTVNGTGSAATFAHSYGVRASGLTVTGSSTVIGTGGAAKDHSFGVYAQNGLLSVTDNSTVNGTAGTVTNYSYGVYAGALTVSGGSTVTGTGGTAQYNVYGVRTDGGNIEISSSSLFGTAGAGRTTRGIIAQGHTIMLNGTPLTSQPTAVRAALITQSATLALALPDGTAGYPYNEFLIPGGTNGTLAVLLNNGDVQLNINDPDNTLPEGLKESAYWLNGTPEKVGQYKFSGVLSVKHSDDQAKLHVYTMKNGAINMQNVDIPINYSLIINRIADPTPTKAFQAIIAGPARGFDGYVTLCIIDENSNPVASANVRINGKNYSSGKDGTIIAPCMAGITMRVTVITPQFGEVRVRLSPKSGNTYSISITGQPEIALPVN